MTTHTRDTLIAFESRVAAAFERKEIRGPIHLCSHSQAEPLLDVFRDIRPDDWCFGTWRNHFMALLKGVPEDELFAAICAGRSMFFCSARHRVLCSAIVGGILPIALGVALGIQRAGGTERVHVFVGDMCAETGLYHEFERYAAGHGLNVRVVCEDNSYSTNARTAETWGTVGESVGIIRYEYERNRPHTGTGAYVHF